MPSMRSMRRSVMTRSGRNWSSCARASAPLATEAQISRAVSTALPGVKMIRVKDALDAFNAVFAKVMLAVRVAGGVTLAAGALVLAGALATESLGDVMLKGKLQAVEVFALGAGHGSGA